jgi:hypothetical protein
MRTWIVKDKAPRLMALVAMLLSVGTGAHGEDLVLCFGGDGHVAIESRGPEGCDGGEDAFSYTASTIAAPISSSHCGPCVDVALGAASTSEGIAAAKRLGNTFATTFIAALAPPPRHARAVLMDCHAIGFSSEKPHTVVIRC